MSDLLEPARPKKENWGSKMGVVLAVAGSAVGLGNFLRFPGQAVNNGGGAFMVPYIISFLLLGIPIAWCEWTMGRLGGRYGQNSAPGIMFALWRRSPAKIVGAMTLLIPIVIYMYYVLLEAWCLDYCIEFAKGGFNSMFAAATAEAGNHAESVQAVVGAAADHQGKVFGDSAHGILLQGGRTIWLVLVCFLINFFVIYQGVTRGIEVFCKYAMPALIVCAVIILVRVLTLADISHGLGFMWNPDWEKLKDPGVWLAASGQIFFSLSVGFGLILCYASYLRPSDDVVLTSLSASSTNEFCEVILGGLIVVPTAFLFLGAQNATGSTFGLGFVTIPAIMHFMPGGDFFGAMWFGLLFLAAVTSSLSMLQPAIAFLEDGFGMGRRASVTVLGIITAIGASAPIYFSRNSIALDHTDFWCNLLMIVAATFQVLLFGWVLGARRGLKEMNRGADIQVPRAFEFLIKYVTPTFLIVILAMWSWQTLPGYLDGMSTTKSAAIAQHKVYEPIIKSHFADEKLDKVALKVRTDDILGPRKSSIDPANLPVWLTGAGVPVKVAHLRSIQHGDRDWSKVDTKLVDLPSPEAAAVAAAVAAADAPIAKFVFIGLFVFFLLLVALSDIACRNRIRRTIEQAADEVADWEATQ